jgi:chaperonin GroEL
MTSKRNYCNGNELHEKILKGVNILADYVGSTLGPRGRNVLLKEAEKEPFVTKDGVTVSRFVAFEDHFENAGTQIIKQVAAKTNEDAGDGTTTSTILARAALNEAQKFLRSGIAPIELKRGMDLASKEIIAHLREASRPIHKLEDITHIATISANGDKVVGKLVATAVDQAGKDGAINIEEARSIETNLDMVEGFIFDSGYISSRFITDERRRVASYENCLILVTDFKLDSVDEVLPVLELVAREGRPLLIVDDEIEGQILAALILNVLRGTMKVAAVKAPHYGEERQSLLSDLAISTGAKFITRQSGTSLKDIKLKDLGKMKTVEISKNRTTIAGGQAEHEKIEERIENLKTQMKEEESLQACERIQERITRLSNGIAVIRVGGSTQVEVIEKKHRIEDALEAVHSAQLGGIHAGGGVPLIRASEEIVAPKDLTEEQKIGFNIVLKIIKEPIRQMAFNAGDSPDLIVSKVLDSSGNSGWDFSTNKLVDMIEEGIIDPVEVTCCALQNAISATSTLITTGHAIIESK